IVNDRNSRGGGGGNVVRVATERGGGGVVTRLDGDGDRDAVAVRVGKGDGSELLPKDSGYRGAGWVAQAVVDERPAGDGHSRDGPGDADDVRHRVADAAVLVHGRGGHGKVPCRQVHMRKSQRFPRM